MRIFYIFCMVFVSHCTDLDEPINRDSGTEDAGVLDEDLGDVVEVVEVFEPFFSDVPHIKTQCNTVCETNEDCAQWQGICAIIYDGYKVRSLCTEDCSESKECSESGFFCIPLYKGSITEFNWQCMPVEGPICQGDE